MKISIVIVEGAKQIMMTPETEHEKKALKFIEPNDELTVISKVESFMGSFSNEYNHANLQVEKCRAGYLRAFSEKESLMFLIKDKLKELI